MIMTAAVDMKPTLTIIKSERMDGEYSNFCFLTSNIVITVAYARSVCFMLCGAQRLAFKTLVNFYKANAILCSATCISGGNKYFSMIKPSFSLTGYVGVLSRLHNCCACKTFICLLCKRIRHHFWINVCGSRQLCWIK